MLQFIVLGIIPGTHLQITYKVFVATVFFLVCLILLQHSLRWCADVTVADD